MNEFPIKKLYYDEPIFASMYTAYKNKSSMSALHYHNGYELFFVTQGNMEFLTKDGHFTLEKRCVMIIPPYVTHRSIYSKTDETYRVEIIANPKKITDNTSGKWKQFTIPTLLKIPPKQTEIIYSLLKRLNKELDSNEEYSDELQKLYFDELLIYLIRYGEKAEMNPKKANIVHSAMEYINNNLQNKIYISDIAEHLHINERTLFSEFKKVAGLTITEYTNMSRIIKAENLLLHSDLSIYDIAFECGFNDRNYFSSTFKKIKGFPPSKLLKKRTK